MSLQDIKQVLSKIIKLNKNLDENRLNTLLEAGGWEKQNKQEALSIFKIIGAKKEAKQIAQETHKELSTEVVDQELVIVDKNELSTEVDRENVINFIPANLPIKEEDRQEIFIANNKPAEVAPVINFIPEKTVEKIIENKIEEKGLNWTPLLAILLIIFLIIFGYLYSHGILK